MVRDRNVHNFYNDLITMSEQAFDQGLYEIAFHCLSAAMHAAEALDDLHRLGHVYDIATRQSRLLDTHTPTHIISSQSAKRRGNASIYASLLTTIEATQARLRLTI